MDCVASKCKIYGNRKKNFFSFFLLLRLFFSYASHLQWFLFKASIFCCCCCSNRSNKFVAFFLSLQNPLQHTKQVIVLIVIFSFFFFFLLFSLKSFYGYGNNATCIHWRSFILMCCLQTIAVRSDKPNQIKLNQQFSYFAYKQIIMFWLLWCFFSVFFCFFAWNNVLIFLMKLCLFVSEKKKQKFYVSPITSI